MPLSVGLCDVFLMTRLWGMDVGKKHAEVKFPLITSHWGAHGQHDFPADAGLRQRVKLGFHCKVTNFALSTLDCLDEGASV